MDLNLKLEIMAVEYNHQKQMEHERLRAGLVSTVREVNVRDYHHFLESQKRMLKGYMWVGVPLGVVAAVVTRSLFIYPTVVNLLGLLAYSQLKKP